VALARVLPKEVVHFSSRVLGQVVSTGVAV